MNSLRSLLNLRRLVKISSAIRGVVDDNTLFFPATLVAIMLVER